MWNFYLINITYNKNKKIFTNNKKLSSNFWSTSGMMASYYEILSVMSNWLVKKGVKREDAQKYITSLFLALSEDAIVNSKKDLKYCVKKKHFPAISMLYKVRLFFILLEFPIGFYRW